MTRDDRLAALITEAVADVEPTDRLAELRARTAVEPARRRWVVAGAAALATAAAVTAVAVVGDQPQRGTDPGPAGSGGTPHAVAAYFVGEGPDGDRLFREFQQVTTAPDPADGLRLLEAGPRDPDYASLWPTGAFGEVTEPSDGQVQVELRTDLPDAESLAAQQVVYTLRAGYQDPDLEVEFVYREAITEPVAAAPALQVLSLVNLSDPAEGQVVDGTLEVRGVANSFEANVPWRIAGTGLSGFFTATDWMGERLFPFSGDVDVSSLDPGTYTLIVETDDPSGGAEGIGPFNDSRSFVIE